MTVRLRRLADRDLPAVLDLERALFPEDAWTADMFAGELSGRAPGRYYLVAEEDGQIAGYAGLLAPEAGRGPAGRRRRRPEPGGQADVLTVAVAPGRWGRGIGSALLRALLAEAAERGCAEVFLEVRIDNPRAQRLYRRHGFADAGVRRGYYQPSGTDALVMRRPPAAAVPVPAPVPVPVPAPGAAADAVREGGSGADPALPGGAAAADPVREGGSGADPAPPGAAAADPAPAGGWPASPRPREPGRRP